jgi:hypothetical protein
MRNNLGKALAVYAKLISYIGGINCRITLFPLPKSAIQKTQN